MSIKMVKNRSRKILLTCGQSIMEYVLLIGIIITVLFAMQTYMRRGIQAVIQVAADQIGLQEDAETDPEKGAKASSEMRAQTEDTQRLQVFKTGRQELDLIDTTSRRSGSATYISQKEK